MGRQIAAYAVACAGIAAVSSLIGLVHVQLGISNLYLLYLLVVLPVAIWYGGGPAVLASVGAFLAYDWFFVQPLHAFTVDDPAEWLALLLFLVVSIVTSQLAAAQRRRAEEVARREREARALHQLSRLLNAQDELDAALEGVVDQLQRELGLASCAVLLPAAPVPGAARGALVVRAFAGERPPTGDAIAAELRAGPPRGSSTVHVPLVAGEHVVGLLRLVPGPERAAWTPEEKRLLSAAAEQIGRTVERARLRQDATEAEVLRKTDEVRQALLASVSHNLRTPLAAIKASAESLCQDDIQWTEDERRGFLAAILQDAEHLHRLVENLLDMSRIEAGRLRPESGWYPLDILVDDVLARLEPLTAGYNVAADVPDSLPPVSLDYVQIGEVLANLIENAVKYTPEGSAIRVSARAEGPWASLMVEDDGPGIPAEALPHVFEKFYRVFNGDRAHTHGIGLGLAVARGLVEAHGGTIGVESPPPGQPRGTRFTIKLPLRAPAQAEVLA